MTDVKRYRRTGKQIEWAAGKYDTFKLVKKGEYRLQKGSGRSEALALAKDGMLVGTWTKKCAEIGLEPTFCTNSIQKLMTTKAPAWVFSDKNSEGLTYDEVRGSRTLTKAKEKKSAKAEKAAKKAAPKAAKKASKPKAPKEEAAAAE